MDNSLIALLRITSSEYEQMLMKSVANDGSEPVTAKSCKAPGAIVRLATAKLVCLLWDQRRVATYNELSALLDVNVSVVAKMLELCRRLGWIDAAEVYGRGRRYRAKCYAFTPAFWGELSERSSKIELHLWARTLNHLLNQRPSFKTESINDGRTMLWLTCVLLCHANWSATVDRASKSTLSQCSGLSDVTLRKHLEKLKKIGIIRYMVAGKECSALLGRRCSFYLLNVQDPIFKHKGFSTAEFLFVPDSFPRVSLAHVLVNKADNFRDLLIKDLEKIERYEERYKGGGANDRIINTYHQRLNLTAAESFYAMPGSCLYVFLGQVDLKKGDQLHLNQLLFACSAYMAMTAGEKSTAECHEQLLTSLKEKPFNIEDVPEWVRDEVGDESVKHVSTLTRLLSEGVNHLIESIDVIIKAFGVDLKLPIGVRLRHDIVQHQRTQKVLEASQHLCAFPTAGLVLEIFGYPEYAFFSAGQTLLVDFARHGDFFKNEGYIEFKPPISQKVKFWDIGKVPVIL